MAERRALITGASSGIGAATALELARTGADVWLTYTSDEAGAEETRLRCAGEGIRAHVTQFDLRSEASIDELAAGVTSEWGSLQVLVNNGGVCPYQAFDEITFDDWDRVLETNARGTFFLTRALLPVLRADTRSDRSVINVSSVAGQLGGIQTGVHYAASKAAILGVTRTFARLLAAEGIRVNAVCPGPVTSGITDQLNADRRDALNSGVPLGRFGSPDEVAWVIAGLADARSGFVTGATVDVNGGVRID